MQVMKQDCLNNCLFPHCHQSITDKFNTVDIAKKLVCTKEKRKRHFFFGKTRLEVSTGL